MSQIPNLTAAGPRAQIRLEAIGDAWQLVKPQLLAWMGAAFIAVACTMAVFTVVALVGIGSAITSAALHGVGRPSFGANLVLVVVISGRQAVFAGGMTRMAIRQARGETIQVGDVFGATDVFGRLFLFMLALSLIGAVIQILPLGLLLSILVSLILAGFLLFTVPLIVDERLGVMDAVRGSMDAVRGQVPMAVLFIVVIGLLGTVGTALCIVPGLFTIPLAVSSIGVVYRDFFLQPPTAGPIIPAPPAAPMA